MVLSSRRIEILNQVTPIERDLIVDVRKARHQRKAAAGINDFHLNPAIASLAIFSESIHECNGLFAAPERLEAFGGKRVQVGKAQQQSRAIGAEGILNRLQEVLQQPLAFFRVS